MALDRVHEGTRLALRGNQVVPAPRRHVRAVGLSRKPCSDWVGTVEIVKQPAVQAIDPECFLDGGHVKRHKLSVYRPACWSLRGFCGVPVWHRSRMTVCAPPNQPTALPGLTRGRTVCCGTQGRVLSRYAAPNANFVLVVAPHNGLGRAERAKKDTANQARALPGYQGQSPDWFV